MTYDNSNIDTNIKLPWWEINNELIKRTNNRISGNPDIDWINYSLLKHLNKKLPLQNCLSFGCGGGDVERQFAAKNAFIHCDGYEDTGEYEIKRAVEKARMYNLQHISYHTVDMNHLVLPQNNYDAVWVNGALHHIENLEYVCHQIRQSLRTNGLLILNEYIGPSRFQFSQDQKNLINNCLQLLPVELRIIQARKLRERNHILRDKGLDWFVHRFIDKIREGNLLETIFRRFHVIKSKILGQSSIISRINFPTVRDVMAWDPTLAIRSGDIIPILQNNFRIIEKRDWGGNILNFLLSEISANFVKSTPVTQSYLRLLIAIEDSLLDMNRFDSDFVYIVAYPILK